jgi:phosphatidylinositol dimannoside acyltransferase
MSRRRDAAVRALYRLGWAGAGRLPRPVAAGLIAVGSRVAVRRGGRHVDNLRTNLTVAGGAPAGPELVRAGMASYLRTFHEVLALPHWPVERVRDAVVIENRAALDAAVQGPGAVVALPHSGNWDLAGAWACSSGMPVSTVAEQLGDAEFAAFLAFRESLGMQVLSHRDPTAIATLVGALRAGRVVCLIADRDLDGTGVPVQWRGVPVTMPAGPALVARRSGAALLPAVCRYDGPRMRIAISDPVPVGPGREGLITATQAVADFFAARIAEQPQDWHMLQRFFPVAA